MLPGDEEERRYFSFFRSRTAPGFAAYYDEYFWDRYILQIGHAEPAVHHAVVALASLHEAFSGNTGYKPGGDQYGLKQYNKSLAGLNTYMSTAKDKSVDIVLICCILFTSFESLRGDYHTAAQHLHSGLKILSHSRQDLHSSKIVHADIMPVFIRLRIQVRSIIDHDLTLGDATTEAICVPKRFLSLGEARNTFYSLMSLVIDFCWVREPNHEKCEVQSKNQAEFLQQAYHVSLLEEWQVAFDGFLSQSSTSIDSKDLCGAILLKIHHATLAIVLDGNLAVLQCSYDRCLPQFRKIVSLASSLIEATEEIDVTPGRNRLWVDMGIIAPLFFVATKCRDPFLRREAVRLISSPRREGTWDAQAAVAIAKRVIAIEEEGLSHVDVAQDVPESSRIYALQPSQMDLVANQARVLFRQNVPKLGDNTYAFEEGLIWHSASYQ